MNDDPSTLALKPFQEAELPKLIEGKRRGIIWDMGLGKTCCASTIGTRTHCKDWLIICPDNAFSVWRDEAPRWIRLEYPNTKIVVRFMDGSPWWRDAAWQQSRIPQEGDVRITIVTHETFLKDWGETWKQPGRKKKLVRLKERKVYPVPDIVIIDEARRLRNPDTQFWIVVDKWLRKYQPQYFYPMTGTPGHEPKHFWGMLHLFNPGYFSSYWKFVGAFHTVIKGVWGLEIGEPRNLNEWYKILNTYFSVKRESDFDVVQQRPPLTRQLLSIDMEPKQKELFTKLRDELLAFINVNRPDVIPLEGEGEREGEINQDQEYESEDIATVIAPNQLALTIRLRQVLVCPAILDARLPLGSAIQDFCDTIEPEEHSVIFTPFKSAITLFQRYLQNRGYRVNTLYGSMGTRLRDQAIEDYRRHGGVIICSVLYAQAFSLEPATRCFFIGYDWDPDNNRQAEKRLHRLTTHTPITAYYYAFRSTFDERLCTILNIKQQNVNMTLPANLQALLTDQNLTKI